MKIKVFICVDKAIIRKMKMINIVIKFKRNMKITRTELVTPIGKVSISDSQTFIIWKINGDHIYQVNNGFTLCGTVFVQSNASPTL